MNFSWQHALKKGWVTRQQMDAALGKNSANVVPRIDSPPQVMLWDRIELEWPGRAVWELKGAIPGRRYQLDIAFPQDKVCVEYDGIKAHSYRGKKGKAPDGSELSAVEADREKDLVLREHGWELLRYSRAQIVFAMDRVIEDIRRKLEYTPACLCSLAKR